VLALPRAQHVDVADDAEDPLVAVHDRHRADLLVDEDLHDVLDVGLIVHRDGVARHHVGDGHAGVVPGLGEPLRVLVVAAQEAAEVAIAQDSLDFASLVHDGQVARVGRGEQLQRHRDGLVGPDGANLFSHDVGRFHGPRGEHNGHAVACNEHRSQRASATGVPDRCPYAAAAHCTGVARIGCPDRGRC
jgi:hypothetical protein